MLPLVEHGVEEQVLGAAAHGLGQSVDDLLRPAEDGDLLRQLRSAVEGGEPLGEALARASPVPVDRQVYALATGNSAGSRLASASICCTRRTSSTNWLVGEEPAPMKPEPSATARLSAFGWWAPNQRGGCGFCTGFGSMAAWLSEKNLPLKVTRGSVQSRFMTSIPSSKRAARRSADRPWAG